MMNNTFYNSYQIAVLDAKKIYRKFKNLDCVNYNFVQGKEFDIENLVFVQNNTIDASGVYVVVPGSSKLIYDKKEHNTITVSENECKEEYFLMSTLYDDIEIYNIVLVSMLQKILNKDNIIMFKKENI